MNKSKVNQRQKKIRDLEWNAIQDTLQKFSGNFLDIGTGTGYAMYKADKIGFQVYGIEPSLNEAGVNDSRIGSIVDKIQQGYAEQLPFDDRFFQVVYASHSLEHFQDMHQGLTEMQRVLDDKGLAIIIVPTGFMAFINLITQYIFHTHRRIGRFLFKGMTWRNFRHIFLPNAHGSQNTTIAEEIVDFSVKRWKRLIERYFQIEQTFLPCLYPYPDVPQLFPYISNNKVSSSVVFICHKKST
jgi:ubiquinone/menaquinone biosynthesis C-methylase UbiE